jgi:hypothetical protein
MNYLHKHERHFLSPKGRHPLALPAIPTDELSWLAAGLAPPERRAMREIVIGADLLEVDGLFYLLAPVSPETIDAMAAFEAETEDRENDLDDETGYPAIDFYYEYRTNRVRVDDGESEDDCRDAPIPDFPDVGPQIPIGWDEATMAKRNHGSDDGRLKP